MTQVGPAALEPRRRSRAASWLFWGLLGLMALLLWLWPTGLRRTQQVFVLGDGTRYEVEYCARWVGWDPPPRAGLERELLDPRVMLDLPRYDFSIRRRGWIGVCTHNLAMAWEDVTGWWDGLCEWFGAVKDRCLVRSRGWDHDINFDLLGVDIRRDGTRLELSEADRQRLYAAMGRQLQTIKEWNQLGPGIAYEFTDLVHCDGTADGEWLIIAGYLLRCDGRRLWIEAGTLRP